MSLLPAGSVDREAYVRAHESLGLVVLGRGLIRLAWLTVSWEIRAAHAPHIGPRADAAHVALTFGRAAAID